MGYVIIKDKLIRVIFVEAVIDIGGHYETVHKNVTDIVTLPPKPPNWKNKNKGNIQRKKRITKKRAYVLGRYRNVGNIFHNCNVLSRGVLRIGRRIHRDS